MVEDGGRWCCFFSILSCFASFASCASTTSVFFHGFLYRGQCGPVCCNSHFFLPCVFFFVWLSRLLLGAEEDFGERAYDGPVCRRGFNKRSTYQHPTARNRSVPNKAIHFEGAWPHLIAFLGGVYERKGVPVRTLKSFPAASSVLERWESILAHSPASHRDRITNKDSSKMWRVFVHTIIMYGGIEHRRTLNRSKRAMSHMEWD